METLFEITQSNNIEDAEQLLADYLKKHLINENEYYFFTRASIYEKFGFYELALYNYKMAIGVNAKFILAYESILRMFIKENISDDIYVQEIVDTLDELDKKNAEVVAAKGLIALKQGCFSDAINFFEEAIKNKNRNTKTLCYLYNSLGICYEKKYEREEAEEFYKHSKSNYYEAIKINKDYYQAWNNLAVLYLKIKNYKAALDKANKCLEINPSYPHGLNTLGLIYDSINNYENAILYYSKAYQCKPDFFAPLTNIGTILDYEFKNELCEIYYRLAYELDPENLITCFNYGNYFRKYKKDFKKAADYLELAYNKQPNNLLCTMSIALLEYGKCNYKESFKLFSQALYFNKQYDQAKFCLIACELHMSSSISKTLSFMKQIISNTYQPLVELRSRIECCENINELDITDLFEIVEYDYIKVREQIIKTHSVSPIYSFEDAYKYISEHFYEMN